MKKFIICLLLFLYNGLLTFSCPEGWLSYNKECLLPVLSPAVNFFQAFTKCSSWNARLAEVPLELSERIFFQAIADAHHRSFWIYEYLKTQGMIAQSSKISFENPSTELGFICVTSSYDIVPECVTEPLGMYFLSSCVFVRHNKTTREEATNECGPYGNLLDISDKYRASLARVLAMSLNESFWVGNTQQEKEECMMVDVSGTDDAEFKWSTSGCGNVTSRFICEIPTDRLPVYTSSSTTSTPQPTTTTRKPRLLCPKENWKTINDMCYWETSYETERMTWDEARKFCQSYGGDLASYSDFSEEIFALNVALGMIRGSWMGLRRIGDSNDFQWSDGSPLNYTKWNDGEPRHLTHLNCVTNAGPHSNWEVSYCGARRWFVCKAKKVSNPVAPSKEPQLEKVQKCSSDGDIWYLHGDSCYLIQLSRPLSWKSAQLYCEDHSAHLVSVHSYNDTDFILHLLDTHGVDDYWIGLSSIGLGSTFSWSDGTSIDFINWEPDKDRETKMMYRCILMNSLSGFWHVGHCNADNQFVCRRKINGTADLLKPATPLPLQGFCPKSWYVFGNKCYKPYGFLPSDKVTWQEANNTCSNLGGTLVTIHSADEQEFLVDLLHEIGYEAWIGMKLNKEESVFEWLDGSLIDYTNWNEREPYLFGAKENCVEMQFSNILNLMGKWNDIGCDKTKGYICQLYKDTSLSDPGTDPSACPKQKGWKKFATSCYQLFREPKSWLEAQQFCQRYNATLTPVDNFAISLFLKKLAADREEDMFWIGVREMEKDSYRSFAQYPLTYSNWPPGQPKRVSLLNNCVAVTSRTLWFVTECDNKLPFFCKMKIDSIDTSPNVDEGICPNSSLWQNVKGPSCFLIDTKARLNWNSALRKCFYYGGTLASFHSSQQVNSIASYIQTADVPLYIGLGKKHDGSYGWVDRSPIDYTNWEVGEPNHAEEDCVEIYSDVLTWNDVACSENRGFICSAPKVPFNGTKRSKKMDEHRKSAETHLAVSGIIGIIVCSMVVMAIAAAFFYYTCPKTSHRTRRLSVPETPLYESTSSEMRSFE